MKTVSLLSLLLLMLSVTISCSDSSASESNVNSQVVVPKNGKTIIVDVRTPQEWVNDGHADCAVNYPLDELSSKIETLKSYEKVVVVCRSGNRANAAKGMLEQNGISDVENMGAWQNIDCK